MGDGKVLDFSDTDCAGGRSLGEWSTKKRKGRALGLERAGSGKEVSVG